MSSLVAHDPTATMQALIRLLRGECSDLSEDRWREFRKMAEWHGVMPLVCQRALESTRTPETICAELRATSKAMAQRNLLLTAELLRILDAFHSAGVPALAYKGPALAVAAYGDIAKRDFGDLDLLLRPEDIGPARRALERAGFVPFPEFAGLTAEQERAYLRSGYHFQYGRPDGAAPVELHWNIAPHVFGIAAPMETLFRRAVSAQVGGRAVPAPSDEDHLLLLCIHGAKHAWDKLRLIADVAQLVAKPAMDVEYILRSVVDLHVYRMALLGLKLAESVFGATLLDSAASGIQKDGVAAKLSKRVITNLPRCRSAEQDRVRAHRFYFDVRERPQDKLRYLYRLAFEPSLNDARLLGDSPIAARAGGWLRPLRVAGTAMRHSVSGVFRRSE
jgi:hypothetical protein